MNQDYICRFIKAGLLAKEVRLFGQSLIKKGASYNHVLDQIQKKIIELGAIAAFPPQLSLNEVAAHFLLPPGKDLIFTDEVVKLDVGVCYEGAIGDTAVTIDLSGNYGKLIEATEAALLACERTVKVGVAIRELGRVIEQTIESFGFSPVRNLAGHGLGEYKIHTSPQIPNYADHSKGTIQPGMTIAVEPFATLGKGVVFEKGESMLFSVVSSRAVKDPVANALLKTLQPLKGLPFSLHQIIRSDFPIKTAKSALKTLLHAQIIEEYPPLIEETFGIVAQAENSILIDNDGQVIVTTR